MLNLKNQNKKYINQKEESQKKIYLIYAKKLIYYED